MTIKVETGTWTGSGSTPQTITLADSTITPVAIICWVVRQGAAAAGFVASQALSIGFGTRQGGSTQSGCVGLWSSDNVATGACGRVRNTTLLHVLSAKTTTDYTVSLSSFAAGQFTVTYSSAANASGDVFAYMVIGGLSNAVVLNKVLSSTGATEAETGAGFKGNCLLCLDADLAADDTPTTNLALSFGCASSASKFWSMAVTATDGDTMTTNMNWNKACRTDACLERLTINADTSDARWDLDSFDDDGFTLGVVDAPGSTDRISTFLLLQGAAIDVGSKNKATGTGNDTFTLADTSVNVTAVIMGCIRAATGVTAASCDMMLGAGSTANATRGSAVNNSIGIVGPEAISTTADRFSATDSVIEELTGGASPAETSEAWFDTKGQGSFIIDWAVNGGSSNPVFYLAIGEPIPASPPQFPSRLYSVAALFTAAHLAFAGPIEPPAAAAAPDHFAAVYPERVVRQRYPVEQQPFEAARPSRWSFARHFNFANPDSLTFTGDPTSSPLTAVTVEAWIKLNTSDEGNDSAGIVWKPTTSARGFFVAYALSRDGGNVGKYRFAIIADDTQTVFSTQAMGSGLSSGVWYFLVGRWTTGEALELRIYDEAGVLVTSTTSASTVSGNLLVSSSEDLWIGREHFAYYTGDICRVRVYGSKRSNAQIESDRTSTAADTGALLQANMGSPGSTEPDVSGHFSAGSYVGTTGVHGPYTTPAAEEAPFWCVEFPPSIKRAIYLATEQLHWAYGNEPIGAPSFVQNTELTWYPDRLDKTWFATSTQRATAALDPRPERTRQLEDAEFPGRIDGRYYRTEQQLAVTELSPKPERTSTLAHFEFPSRIDGRAFATTQQLAVTELSPKPERTSALAWEINPDALSRRSYPTAEQAPFAFVRLIIAASAPDQFHVVYPDRLPRRGYPTHAQQVSAIGRPPTAFVQNTELVWFPDGVVRPRFPAQQQLAVTELPARPERTALLDAIEFPSRLEPRYYPHEAQLAFSASQQPERAASLEDLEFPSAITRRAFSSALQLTGFSGIEPPVVVPPPELLAAIYPDVIAREFYPAHIQAEVAAGQLALVLTDSSSPILNTIPISGGYIGIIANSPAAASVKDHVTNTIPLGGGYKNRITN